MPARPATKVSTLDGERRIPPPREPSERALRAASKLDTQLQHRAAKVRFDFIRTPEGAVGPPPPLALLLRGGRGGDVRLKLLLSLFWVAGGGDDRHKTKAYPARAWAALLDLPDPEGNGQRRIRDAVQWLEDQRFVRTHREPGKPMSLQLLLEDGSGKAYFDPAVHARRKKVATNDVGGSDLYVALPASLWTDGWLATLSGRALAMLLVLAEVTFTGKEWDWVSPGRARQRYGLSEDTWSRGIAELKARKLIEIRKRSISEDDFEFRRVRNTYKVPRDKSNRIALPERPSTLPRGDGAGQADT